MLGSLKALPLIRLIQTVQVNSAWSAQLVVQLSEICLVFNYCVLAVVVIFREGPLVAAACPQAWTPDLIKIVLSPWLFVLNISCMTQAPA
jgi:hypothetical protein